MEEQKIPQNFIQIFDEDESTAEDIKILDERRKKHLSGDSETYTWPEVRKMILGNRA
jgi:hypothetical protein